MSGITKPAAGRRRARGLRKLSPDFISKATDETAAQVTRIGLTFLGTTAFCLLSLPSPDSALLGGSERISVPFAGPVSFFGFMLLGPAVLIVLRIYLQIYVEHSERLDRLARSMLVLRAPTLIPLQNPLIRCFSALIFYPLLPLTMMLFAWKAAVIPAWGSGLLCVAVGVVASHLMLLLNTLSWRSKVLTTGAAIVVAGITVVAEPMRRPFELFRANLSGQWLVQDDLRGANLSAANLSGAYLIAANLGGAFLRDANLSGAKLGRANLSGANLDSANLSGASLSVANLSGANLGGANLSGASLGAANLTGANLSGANLSGAFGAANLSGAFLGQANLSGADLSGAHLNDVNLVDADLRGVNLNSADLRDADLRGADLMEAKNLTQEQLDTACGNASTKLPERDGKRMIITDCPP